MSLEKLMAAVEQRSADAVARQIDRFASTPTPPGITAEAIDGGIALTGIGLRRRMLDDPKLRNFRQ